MDHKAGPSHDDDRVAHVAEQAREETRRYPVGSPRTMIYLACRPAGCADVFVGDEDELVEVRWVSLTEADELLPGMFEPVRDHLTREFG